MKFMSANRIAPDGRPRSVASHLGIFCLPMSHKKDARLIWVKRYIITHLADIANTKNRVISNNNSQF